MVIIFAVKQNEIKSSSVYNAMDGIYAGNMFWQ